MKIHHLKGDDIEKTVPADGESIEVIIPQTEQDEFLCFDLTLACMLTEDLKSAVNLEFMEATVARLVISAARFWNSLKKTKSFIKTLKPNSGPCAP